jgi:hypothetical protein
MLALHPAMAGCSVLGLKESYFKWFFLADVYMSFHLQGSLGLEFRKIGYGFNPRILRGLKKNNLSGE